LLAEHCSDFPQRLASSGAPIILHAMRGLDLRRLALPGAIHHVELDQHAEFVPAYPFFRDFPVPNAKDRHCLPVDGLPCHFVTAEAAHPLSAIHRLVAQPAGNSVTLSEQIMNRSAEFAIGLEYPFQRVPECFAEGKGGKKCMNSFVSE